MQIPIVIVGEILQFAAVFDRKKLNALNPKHLGQRVCTLYSPTYGAMIDANRVLKFIEVASRAYSWWRGTGISVQSGRILDDMLTTDGSINWLKEMVNRPSTEHLMYCLLWKMSGIRNGMKRLIDADFYDLLVNPLKTMFLVTSKWDKDLEAFKMVSSGIVDSNLELEVLRSMLRRGLFDFYCDSWIEYIRNHGLMGWTVGAYAAPNNSAFSAVQRMINVESSLDTKLLIEGMSRIARSESLITRLRTI